LILGCVLDTMFSLKPLTMLAKNQTENHGVGGSIPPLGTKDPHNISKMALWLSTDPDNAQRGGATGAQTVVARRKKSLIHYVERPSI
jgi:hypothetical protein